MPQVVLSQLIFLIVYPTFTIPSGSRYLLTRRYKSEVQPDRCNLRAAVQIQRHDKNVSLIKLWLTFAVRDIGGAIKICTGVARAGDAVVLTKLRLVCSHRAPDTSVCCGVVIVSRRTVNCKVWDVLFSKNSNLQCRELSSALDIPGLQHSY